MWLRHSFFLLVFALGCGNTAEAEAPPQAAAEPLPTAGPEEPTPVPAAAGNLLRALPPDTPFVLFVSGEELRANPSGQALTILAEQMKDLKQGLLMLQTACGIDPLSEIREAALATTASYDGRRMRGSVQEATAVIALQGSADRALDCINRFLPTKPANIPGLRAFELPNGQVVQAYRELLIYGSHDTNAAAPSRIDSGAAPSATVQAALNRFSGSTFWAAGNGDNPFGLKNFEAGLMQNARGAHLTAGALASDPAQAEKAEEHINLRLKEASDIEQALTNSADARAQLPASKPSGVLERGHLVRDGTRLHYSLSLSKEEAEHFFSHTLIKLVTAAAANYLGAAKSAEARDNVMKIALLLSDHVRAQTGVKRFPPSAPLAPPKPPGQNPVTGDFFSHKSWKAIGFSMREPTHFSYEFVTDKSRKSVQVFARGDLDGDGVQSSYSVRVTLVGGEPKVGTKIEQENPGE